MKKTIGTLLLMLVIAFSANARNEIFEMSKYGVRPGAKNNSLKFVRALDKIKASGKSEGATLVFEPGRYDFYPDASTSHRYQVSNHGLFEGSVGLCLEGLNGVTLEGKGADFVFHGRMMPISLQHSTGCTLKNFTIDFDDMALVQSKVVSTSPSEGTVLELLPDQNSYIGEDNTLCTDAEWGYPVKPSYVTVVDGRTRRIAYNTGDRRFPNHDIEKIGDNLIKVKHWYDKQINAGNYLVMRCGERPSPGIFMNDDTDTKVENVKVYYAHGMGLLAQMSTNVTLDAFEVCLKDSTRYVSAMCDATHFSQCSGLISSCNGRYECMGDDAINVHGICMQVGGRPAANMVRLKFMHNQAMGIEWGRPGDTVEFISKSTCLPMATGVIKNIRPDGDGFVVLTMEEDLPDFIVADNVCAENLNWTADLVFKNNWIGRNRARGSLITTRGKVLVEGNTYDHVGGTAILFSGDCNYWYESGPCKDVIVRNNTFINNLSSPYQFCEAVISIFPVIPDLEAQDRYYHDTISITGNKFFNFGAPIIYAESIKNLIFKDNEIKTNNEFKPIGSWSSQFRLKKVGFFDAD